MISPALARRLRDQGLHWTPALHDRFMIPDRDLDEQVFVIAELTIDVEKVAGHATIMFNGAVEWSLDYIFSQDVVWLPNEEQLRGLLDGQFVALTRVDGGYRCDLELDDMTIGFTAETGADAYGQALLHVMYARDPEAANVQSDAAPPVWGAPGDV